MEEILKKICEDNLQKLKNNELNNLLNKTPLETQTRKGEKYKIFMSNITKDMFDEIILKDFSNIQKHTINNDFIFEENELAGSFVDSVHDIDIYEIPNLKKFFFFADNSWECLNHKGSLVTEFEYIESNPDDFIDQLYSANNQVSQEQYEQYEDYEFVNFDINTPMCFFTNTTPKNIAELSPTNKKSSNFIDLLQELYDIKKVDIIINIIETYRTIALETIFSAQTQLIEQNKSSFYLSLWRDVFKEYTNLTKNIRRTLHTDNERIKVSFSNEDIKIIEDLILQSKYVDKVAKLLYTFIQTRQILNHIQKNKYEFFDLTFIAVSLFKVVEILFNELLNKKWPNLYVKTEYGQINFADNKLTLGNMNQIFEEDKNIFIPQEIRAHLNSKGTRKAELKSILSRWISKTRNGFLHKDLIEINNDMIDSSISDSIAIICLLMLVLN